MLSAYRQLRGSIDCTFRSKPLAFYAAAWAAGILLADSLARTATLSGTIGLILVLGSTVTRQRTAGLLAVLTGVLFLGLGATRLALTPPRGDISEQAGRQVGVIGFVDADPVQLCVSSRSPGRGD